MDDFSFSSHATMGGSAHCFTFASASMRFVKFNGGRWEFYTITQRGKFAGLEKFEGYLSDAQGARLDRVLEAQVCARPAGVTRD